MRQRKYIFILIVLIVLCFDMGTVVSYLYRDKSYLLRFHILEFVSEIKTDKQQQAPRRNSPSPSSEPQPDNSVSSSFKSTSSLLNGSRYNMPQDVSWVSNIGKGMPASTPHSSAITYKFSRSITKSSAPAANSTPASRQTVRRHGRSADTSPRLYDIGALSVPAVRFTSTSALLAVNTERELPADATTRRHLPSDPPDDPFTDPEAPIGDVPWVMVSMLLLACTLKKSQVLLRRF